MLGTFRPRLPRVLLGLSYLSALLASVNAENDGFTVNHEAGRCAIRGQCGKKSFFGGELPCPDNEVAEAPDRGTREKLVKICGNEWSTGDVCCRSDQVITFPCLSYYLCISNEGPGRCAQFQSEKSRTYDILLSGM